MNLKVNELKKLIDLNLKILKLPNIDKHRALSIEQRIVELRESIKSHNFKAQ